MTELFRMAWRNIWRNTIRSGIVISAVGLGVWALIFILGFTSGMVNNYVDSAIVHKTSHLQIHEAEWLDDPLVKNNIPFNKQRNDFLNEDKRVKSFSKRIIVNGTAATASSTRGVQVFGVNYVNEDETTELLNQIESQPVRIDSIPANGIFLGVDLADELKLEVGSKVILNFAGKGGEIQSNAFRVSGIYDTGNIEIDEGRIYLDKNKLAEILDISVEKSHEIAILLKDKELVESTQADLQEMNTDLSVRNYREISPDLALMGDQLYVSMGFMIVIVLLALVFGIINTMLMVILERTKELGMLMAIGMNKFKLFLMIVIETLMLSLIGAPFGMFLGWLFIIYFQDRGIDLAMVAEGMKEFGMSSVLYPEVDPIVYLLVGAALVIMAFLASLYPAFKAVKLRPVEALRKI